MNKCEHLSIDAYKAVKKALRNKQLIRLNSCEVCNATLGNGARKIVAHHHAGYAPENWLNVWWVCQSCNYRMCGRHNGSLTLEQAKAFVVNWSFKNWVESLSNNEHWEIDGEDVIMKRKSIRPDLKSILSKNGCGGHKEPQ